MIEGTRGHEAVYRERMRSIAPVAVVVLSVALASVSTTSPSAAQSTVVAKSPAPAVLGISTRFLHSTLGWFDPLTLKAIPGRKAPLAGHAGSWAFSADRSVLAIGGCQEHALPSIRFVNARAMRVLGDVRIAPGGDCVERLAWLRPRRLLAIVTGGTSSDAALVVIDPVARKVLRRTEVAETDALLWSSLATSDELVLLMAKDDAFAPARITLVDADGDVRPVIVDRVVIGTVFDEDSADPRATTVSPGFAVDPDGRRAFLVPASGPVAAIDLQTLDVSYHPLDHASLLKRFLRWLEPAAAAKSVEGPHRYARWIGDGLLAVAGTEYSVGRDARGGEVEVEAPAGVWLIDTRSWSSTMLSSASNDFGLAPGLVIAEGGRWDSNAQKLVGPGVIAFGFDGRERWRLPQSNSWMDAHRGLGYGYVAREGALDVYDLETGTLLRTIKIDHQAPTLLDAKASDW
jgi:hypothetical protein